MQRGDVLACEVLFSARPMGSGLADRRAASHYEAGVTKPLSDLCFERLDARRSNLLEGMEVDAAIPSVAGASSG